MCGKEERLCGIFAADWGRICGGALDTVSDGVACGILRLLDKWPPVKQGGKMSIQSIALQHALFHELHKLHGAGFVQNGTCNEYHYFLFEKY